MNESTLVPREEMSDLDWLARNMHEWNYSNNYCYVSSFNSGRKCFSSAPHTEIYSKVTKLQWLARRAELQSKPSWKDAPEWSNWLAQEPRGRWVFYREKPEVHKFGYWAEGIGAIWHWSAIGKVLGDWRGTLEKRPEQKAFEPFVSVEYAKPKCGASIDVAFNNMKPDAGLKSSRETCNRLREEMEIEDAATAKQPTPKGSGNPILGMVLADLTNRALEGKEKYGEPLLAHNGRNPLWDAYQEALDLAMYLRQAIEEQK